MSTLCKVMLIKVAVSFDESQDMLCFESVKSVIGSFHSCLSLILDPGSGTEIQMTTGQYIVSPVI